MARKFYNPNKYPVSFTTEDGGRLTLQGIMPGRAPQTVEGDYYASLLKKGILAEWDKSVEKKLQAAYLKLFRGQVRLNVHQRKTEPLTVSTPSRRPVGVTADEADEPVKKAPPVKEDVQKEPLFTAEALEEVTVKELRNIIEVNGMGEPDAGAKKADLIQFILDNQ